MIYDFPSRTFCQILDEMRACYKTHNYASIIGLIEELQIIGNRMEAGLDAKKTYFGFRDEIKKLKKELKSLEKEKSND